MSRSAKAGGCGGCLLAKEVLGVVNSAIGCLGRLGHVEGGHLNGGGGQALVVTAVILVALVVVVVLAVAALVLAAVAIDMMILVACHACG
eukprot:1236084-Pleurochrysis_carterae.AAC.1